MPRAQETVPRAQSGAGVSVAGADFGSYEHVYSATNTAAGLPGLAGSAQESEEVPEEGGALMPPSIITRAASHEVTA